MLQVPPRRSLLLSRTLSRSLSTETNSSSPNPHPLPSSINNRPRTRFSPAPRSPEPSPPRAHRVQIGLPYLLVRPKDQSSAVCHVTVLWAATELRQEPSSECTRFY